MKKEQIKVMISKDLAVFKKDICKTAGKKESTY